ncbi:hypothetical protein [Cutibacterium sp.]|uniref:hypothetical protein n=1 Tax=Cutibacterium sp. TaxID=1912221 RepID=UPI0026DD2F3B|nr:hypothetical protein [Cutibacterium sp.]MDO4412847.1 hypothetical protein [Cutibacterium sp.]
MTLNELIGELQLPISEQEQKEGVGRLSNQVNQSSSYDSIDSYLILLSDDIEDYFHSGKINRALEFAITTLLEDTSASAIGLDGKGYCDVVNHLQKGGKHDWRGLNPKETLRLLSRATFIHDLLAREHLSASQISRLLFSLESSLYVPYKAIQVIAAHFELLPSLSVGDFENVIHPKDEIYSNQHFTDTSADESCEIAGELASPWLDGDSISSDLRLLIKQGEGTILTSENASGWPYLQMLHWCMLPLDRYDHPASFLYEFSPRGALGEAVFAQYHVATGNAVLNNAKAVSQLDDQWARNRSGVSAHALVRILHMVESLPFHARRSVAAIIRAWLTRIIELTDRDLTLINETLSFAQIIRLCGFIQHDESNTQGVIEQRIVDALSVLAFQHEGWIPRGLGDSVNASNFSRHKLGDVEFANIDKRAAIALEAHGGIVSPAYVRGHQQSLARIVQQRLEESWANLDDPAKWSVRVIFVSHGSTGGLPENEIIHEVPISYEYWDYSKLVDGAIDHSTEELALSAFRKYFVQALNRDVVPQRIRNKASQILNDSAVSI